MLCDTKRSCPAFCIQACHTPCDTQYRCYRTHSPETSKNDSASCPACTQSQSFRLLPLPANATNLGSSSVFLGSSFLLVCLLSCPCPLFSCSNRAASLFPGIPGIDAVPLAGPPITFPALKPPPDDATETWESLVVLADVAVTGVEAFDDDALPLNLLPVPA
jgi:hypothetical protein